MNKVAIITARGGSKRIPRKNIKDFRGKPIIAYSIEAALRSELFDMVMVSTDDDEIGEIACKYGAEMPFVRSSGTSDDMTGTADVVCEVIMDLEKTGKKFEYACCIYPTAPFISPQVLKEGFTTLRDNQFTTVFPVCAFSYPIWRGVQFDEKGKLQMIWPDNVNKRSQDLPKAYHDAGQFYWIDVNCFKKEKSLFTSNTGSLILNELHVQDIDTEEDWGIAELKHSLLYP